MLWLSFSYKLNWGSYIISIAETTSKKIGALIRSMKFLFLEIALYLNKSTIPPFIKYCCHVWAGAPSCHSEILHQLQKRIYRTVGLSLAASLEPLACRRNVASLSLSYRYYLVDFHLNWLHWLHFLFLQEGLPVILIDCVIFLSPFLVTGMSMSTVSFFAQLDFRNLCL